MAEETYRIGEAARCSACVSRRFAAGSGRASSGRPGRRAASAGSPPRRLPGSSPRAASAPRSPPPASGTASPGTITEVKRDKLAATVEILAGPHRILAFVTREAVDEMGLKPGMQAVATVKATNVMLEVDE